uniref:Antitoxin n=1 Tax=Methanococcus maripaludis (strain C6 / ATCC BAA-1332) TaxID=444158 RepID=A9A6F5_METM6
MVKAIINISDNSNQILNIVKAKYALKDKSEAIEKVIEEYSQEMLEPNLRPEFVEKVNKIMEKKTVKVGSVQNLRNRYANE